MFTQKRLQELMAFILILGMLISLTLVLTGGVIFLLQDGHTDIYSTVMPSVHYNTHIKQLITYAFTFQPLGIIELGLLALVLTQVCRVALLCVYYCCIHDYKFILISGFILTVLIYSIFLRSG